MIPEEKRMEKQYIKQIFTVLFSSIILAGCATTETAPKPDSDIEANGSDCIWTRTIRDYTVLNDSNLLIHGAGKKSYFVTLLSPSWEMQSSMGMAFMSTDGRLCPFGRDRIVFRGMTEEAVRIRSINEVSVDQAEQLLVRFGKSNATGPQIPESKPVEGAEIEVPD